MRVLADGGCFSLAGVVQALARGEVDSLCGVATPCSMLWGAQDRTHRMTDPDSLLDLVPHATIRRSQASGHFPDIEDASTFVRLLTSTR